MKPRQLVAAALAATVTLVAISSSVGTVDDAVADPAREVADDKPAKPRWAKLDVDGGPDVLLLELPGVCLIEVEAGSGGGYGKGVGLTSVEGRCPR